MAVKLVGNKEKVHKTSTVVLSIFLVVLSLLEIAQPYLDVLAPVIAPGIFPYIAAGFGIAIGIGRYVKQNLETAEGITGDNEGDEC